MTDFDIRPLWIGHWPKPPSGATVPVLTSLQRQALLLDTCLRQVIVTVDPEIAGRATGFHPHEALTGAAAYRFLLEVTTGLRSAVPGETNVFGQFNRAWKAFRQSGELPAVARLEPFITQIVRDTGQIRWDHLQKIGGASYGTLVRRLIRAEPRDRILVVGAGELARVIVPFFRCFDVRVWNRRTPEPAFSLPVHIFAPEDGAAAAEWARHVVMTTPADDANDQRWQQWLNNSSAKTVVHLGRRRAAPLICRPSQRSYNLDDVFELRNAQANIRSRQLEKARIACNDFTRRLVVDLAMAAG